MNSAKSYLFFFSLLFLLQSCFVVKQVKDGETLYAEKKYTLAAEKLKQELNADETIESKAKKSFLIAECYRYSNQTVEAEKWYKTAAGYNYDPIANYYYGVMLKTNGKYEEAIKAFNNYLNEVPFNEEARKQLKATQQALDWQQHPAPYIVTNLESINSQAFDYASVLYSNNALVFTSDRTESTIGAGTFGWTGEKFSDIFIAESDGKGGYKTPASFSPVINSKYNEGAACFSSNFSECYFTRCGSDNLTNDYCNIYYSVKSVTGEWSEPVPLILFDDTSNVSQPFLSADGKELYVSSDTHGGYGGKDLYVCNKTSEGWSDPINLGPQINTVEDETFPNLFEGKLYFASNGQPGMGGLDIFVATKTGKQWGNVQNIKPPINSPADDFGILFQKVPADKSNDIRAMGLFTSSRPGGKGNDDIYQFILPKIKTYVLNGTVLEKTFENPNDPNSKVTGTTLLAVADVTVTVKDSVILNVKTNAKGSFTTLIEAEKYYKVLASKADYFSKSEIVNSVGFSLIDRDTVTATVKIILDKIYKEVQINISNIYYDYNKANIRPDAALVLDTLVTLLKENPDVKVELGSHTDSRGNDKYNMILSQKRAEACVNYLVSKGIDKSRLSAKGYGETQLVNNCGNGVPCTEEEHQKNRRTTFKVLSDKLNIESQEPEKIIQDPERK